MNTFRSEINLANSAVGLKVWWERQEERDQKVKRPLSLDWSYREIADELGCSVWTVANAFRRLEEKRHANFPPKVDPSIRSGSPGRWSHAGAWSLVGTPTSTTGTK